MSRPLRLLPQSGALVEVTARTFQGRYLLRPSRRQKQLFLGCLAHALRGRDVELHAAVAMSTHYHLLLSPRDAGEMAAVMRDFHSNLSKEMGRLHDWSGSLFEDRYHSIPISDEPEEQTARLRYLLSHGCKEGFVVHPGAWPGVHCANQLVDGKPLEGLWVDRTKLLRARQSHRRAALRGIERPAPREEDFTERLTIDLAPLPCWRHLTATRQRSAARDLIASIVDETRARHRTAGTRPRGTRSLRRLSPHRRPRQMKRTPCKRVHAYRRAVENRLLEALAAIEAAYRRAAAALRRGEHAMFPPGTFPPPGPFVPYPATPNP